MLLGVQGIGADARVDTDLPRCLADIVGKTFTFQLRLNDFNFSPKHQTFTISRIFPQRALAPLPAFAVAVSPLAYVRYVTSPLARITTVFVKLLLGWSYKFLRNGAWRCGSRNNCGRRWTSHCINCALHVWWYGCQTPSPGGRPSWYRWHCNEEAICGMIPSTHL